MGFLLGLFKGIHVYIYIVLFSIIGTLTFLNWTHTKKIESQAEEIVEIETAKIRLERSLKTQNDQVRALQAESETLRKRVAGEVLIIRALDEHGETVLLELDKQSIPKEHRGALMWMIQKSMEELKQ